MKVDGFFLSLLSDSYVFKLLAGVRFSKEFICSQKTIKIKYNYCWCLFLFFFSFFLLENYEL